jgi:RNA polymerase sigma factor (TIGR02999 family)
METTPSYPRPWNHVPRPTLDLVAFRSPSSGILNSTLAVSICSAAAWRRRPGVGICGPRIFLVSPRNALVTIDRMSEVTRILTAIEQGDGQAADQLLPLVYDELRRLAAQKLAGEAPGQTLQPTALVHEAFLRLVGTDAEAHWAGRGHFFAAAAQAMRRVLIDNARRKQTQKRGGGRKRQGLDAVATPEPDDELLALDEALQQLAAQDPQKARLVELRYFAGLTGEQAAQVLGISAATADRHWAYARAWLQKAVRGR